LGQVPGAPDEVWEFCFQCREHSRCVFFREDMCSRFHPDEALRPDRVDEHYEDIWLVGESICRKMGVQMVHEEVAAFDGERLGLTDLVAQDIR